jgi:Tol biopolymer transport system component/UPF0716 family protein affecting phage T7 exclusion
MPDFIRRISVASNGTGGNRDSYSPSISANGRYVAFYSYSNNLVVGDTNNSGDIFVYDLFTNTIRRVSVASNGTQGNGNSFYPSISASGDFIAYESVASNLVVGDTNNSRDIFVYDTVSNSTRLVSVASDGTGGNGDSSHASISASGRYIAYESTASNLVVGDTNNNSDIFVYDTLTKITRRVSVSSNGTQGNSSSYSPSISAEGNFIAFESYARNLVTGDTNSSRDIFVYNTVTNTTIRVSLASDGTQANGDSYTPSISASGRYVAFQSYASNLVVGDTNNSPDIFVYDTLTNSIRRVSVASDGTQGNDSSYGPSISADGRYVAFYSYASNLVAGDTNNAGDIFVYDTVTKTTRRISITNNGTQANGRSLNPSISADGSFVAFHSYASNLVSGDTNNNPDIFINEKTPTISINDVTLSEGNNGTTLAIFTVNLSNSSSQTVTVNYATADVTATGGNDYASVAGILTFNPGVTSQTVSVAVLGDTTSESTETFLVNLFNPSNSTLTKNQGRGTIVNDDQIPTISINDVTLSEGNNGTTLAIFTVNLSNSSSQTVTVNYATADVTATGGNDYASVAGILTFNPGVTSQTVSVAVLGDTTSESTETFLVNLFNPSNSTLTKNQGRGTIVNDDATAKNLINGTSISETLLGTNLEDMIKGFGGNDIIVGGIGQDEIYGGFGNDELIGDVTNLVGDESNMDDIIYGGFGNDRLHGGGGNDFLYGNPGNDQIWGDDGDDLIWGGFGNDILTGGFGVDTFVITRGGGTDTIRDFQIGEDYLALKDGLVFASLSITQLGSQAFISDNASNESLMLLSGVNAASLIANASNVFVNI